MFIYLNPWDIEIIICVFSRAIFRLLASPIFIRDAVLHLFIQTDLSVGEMEEKLNERLTFSVDSNSSDAGSILYHRALPPRNNVPSSLATHSSGTSSTGVPPITNTTNKSPQFIRSYSLASSGSDSAGT